MFKAIKSNVEILQLDTIVDNTINDFDRKISQQTFKSGFSREDVAKLEANLIEKAFESYDRRASNEIGRKVPSDWNSDNKDVIAVRKRKLRRELDKRKGILLQLFDGTVSGKLAELDSFLRNLEEVNGNFYRSLEFPIAQSVLKVALTNHETMVLAKIREDFEGGLDTLNSQSIVLKGEASGSVFLQRVKHMANTALLENYNTAAQARNAFVKRALDKVQDHLRLQLEAIALNVALEADSSLDYCDEDERKKTKDVLCEISKQYLNLDSSVEELALASLAISAAETEADLEITEIL